jgi:PAS domain S-box-containing protein
MREDPSGSSPPTATVPETTARHRVLVVDDDAPGRYALVHPLERAGFLVDQADTGRDALRLCAEKRPEAVVLDINLPDMDGREVCRRLKSSADCSAIPIVQVSATYRSDDDWATALERGADVFLPQPVPPAVLIATLNALLRTREVERRLEDTLHSITDAYIALDDEWRFLALNRRAEEILGVRTEEVRGRDAWAGHPDAAPDIRAQYERARAENRPVHFEARSTVLDRWFEIHAYPRPGRLDIYLRDITDRKRTDEELARSLARERKLRAEAEAAGRAKDEFLAVLSHELRTPMNAILGWLTVLRSKATTPDLMAKAMDVIHRNVMAQNQLIVDLLDVSRIVSGKLVVEKRPLDAAEPVRAALETLRPVADAKGVKLEVSVPSGLVVSGDPDRLHQVAANLVANAVKFTPPGGTVSVKLSAEQAAAVLVVADTGEGIDAAFLPHVFERFRQADGSHTRRYRGLGLGLAIARYLTEEHGGSIHATSPGPGRGATFQVRIPLGGGAPDPAAAARLRPSAPARLDGVSVLVVEDEEDSRAIVSLLLEQAGAKVTAASSVRDALAALRGAAFDVVVSDIEMPGEDGYALVERIRRDPSHSGVPILALTAHAAESERTRALDAGFAAHVAKPTREGELAAIVAGLLRHDARRPA